MSYQTGLLFEREDSPARYRTAVKSFAPDRRPYYKNHRLTPLPNRRQFTEQLDDPRPFDYVLKGKPPAAFQSTSNHTSISFPDIPKDYTGTVDNIQDIIEQVNAGASWPHDRSGRKLRFGGTYRHRKNDDITRVFQAPTYRATFAKPKGKVVRDPFYQYKPQTMSDINLMATNQFRFAPYQVHITNTGKQHQNMVDLYQQLIRVNNNRDQETNRKNARAHTATKKQKPFSLMLDVYPMPADEENDHTSTTKRPATTFRKPYVMHPGLFMNPTKNVIGAINNLPLHMEQQYFQNMNFPQLKPHRYPPDAQNQYANMYFKKHYTNRDNLGPFYPFAQRGATKKPPTENKPSQITVHLNLFPKNKQERMGIMENLQKEENSTIGSSVEIVPGQTVNVSGTIKVEDSKRNIQILNPDSIISTSAIWAEKRSSAVNEGIVDTTTSSSTELLITAKDHVRFDELQTFYPTIIPIEPRNTDYVTAGESEMISDHHFYYKNATNNDQEEINDF